MDGVLVKVNIPNVIGTLEGMKAHIRAIGWIASPVDPFTALETTREASHNSASDNLVRSGF